jgi:hypothetical protein
MAVLTGNSGEIRFGGSAVGKCRNFSVDISRDALETTVLGGVDRTYVEGLRGATGSATVLYDPDDVTTKSFLNSILSSGTSSIQMVLNTASGGASLTCTAIVTQVSTPVSVGEVTACSINFQITGSLSGTF